MKKAALLITLAICMLRGVAAFGATAPQEPPVEESRVPYITHVVRWFENIKDISKKYGVPVDVISEINGLTKNKIKKGQRLKIPADYSLYLEEKLGIRRKPDATEAIIAQQASGKEAVAPGANAGPSLVVTPEAPPPQPVIVFAPKNSVNAVLLLSLGSGNDNNLDFYSGALMAARDLGGAGTGVDLHVIDLSAESLSDEAIRAIEEADVTIGPVQAAGIKDILSKVGNPSTVLISPLDPRGAALADTTANVIQAPSAGKFQYDDLAEWIISDRKPEDNIVIISEKGARQSEGMTILGDKLSGSGIMPRSFSYTILEGRDILESFEKVFSAEGTNRVAILSESEAFANDVVRNINVLIHNKYNVVLYSVSRIRSYDTIDVENLHNANLHVSMSYFINYNSPEVRKFIASYRALFNSEPNQFAFQGYDVVSYFMKACAAYGKWWSKGILDAPRADGLQSSFKFEKGERSEGLLNTAVRRAVYESDYSVTEIQH